MSFSSFKNWRLVSTFVCLTAIFIAASQTASGASSKPLVVTDHLNNPRGLEVGPDGSLWVAETGGGHGKCQKGVGGQQICISFNGAILRINDGKVKTYATGFLSGSSYPDGSFSEGMDDIAVAGNGNVYAIVSSSGPNPAKKYGAQVAAQSGHALQALGGNKLKAIADVAKYVYDHHASDSNPYSIAASPKGLAVADAGANSLLLVDPESGKVIKLADFPSALVGGKNYDSVPTSVVWHNGAFYVGELSGDAPPNHARIWRVVPGQKPQVYLSGFSAIGGIAFGPDGSLYVTQQSNGGLPAMTNNKPDFTGSVLRVATNGKRTVIATLTAPAGVAVSKDGTVYVATNSISPKDGQIVAIKG